MKNKYSTPPTVSLKISCCYGHYPHRLWLCCQSSVASRSKSIWSHHRSSGWPSSVSVAAGAPAYVDNDYGGCAWHECFECCKQRPGTGSRDFGLHRNYNEDKRIHPKVVTRGRLVVLCPHTHKKSMHHYPTYRTNMHIYQPLSTI